MNIERLKDAYQVIAGIPAEKFVPNLNSYTGFGEADPRVHGVHTCGTLACTAGWLAYHPDFGGRRGSLDVRLDRVGRRLDLVIDGGDALFTWRGSSLYDNEPGAKRLTDKGLALYRIRRMLGQDNRAALRGAVHDCKSTPGEK